MTTLTSSSRFRRKVKSHPRHTDSLASMLAEFRRRGWHRKATARLCLQFAILLGMTFGGLAVFFLCPSLILKALGMAVSALGTLGISTQAHTASHNALSKKKWVNRLFTYLGYPFLLGVSASHWRNKHVVKHHKAPNVDGHDDDIQFMPFFALTEAEAQRSGRLARFYFRYLQLPLLLTILCVLPFNTQAEGWRLLVRRLARKKTRTASHWLDLGALLLHYVLWIVLPLFFFALGPVLLAYVLRMALLGYGMFAVFAPAHLPAEAPIAAKDLRGTDYALLQTATTVNFRTGPLGRFICAGVDFQIEHHLFPNFSHVHYPAMSRYVREFCERHGYPYRTLGWGEGILKALKAFANPKPVVNKLKP